MLACANFFRPSGSSSTAPMSFLDDFFGSLAPRVFPSSLSLPSEGRDGGGRSRDALPAGGVEEPLVMRSVHASSLLSSRFIHGLGVQELLSCGRLLLPFLSRLALPPHLCTLGEVMGRESLRGVFLCSRLPLPPHLCTLGEVVRLPSAAPVRVPPWPPDLQLGRTGG